MALLDDLSQNYRVDEDRICVTGLSMGGFGTWELAAFAPNCLAAIAPICGGGEKYWVKQFAHLPVWAFHGAKDTGVPLERSQIMIDELKKKGANPKLTVYPEAGRLMDGNLRQPGTEVASGAASKQGGVAMSKYQRQQPRKSATKLPNLQKKLQKQKVQTAKTSKKK